MNLIIGFIVIAFIFVPLERLVPLRQGQGTFRPMWKTDVVHFFVTSILVKIGVVVAIAVPVVLLRTAVVPSIAPHVLSQPGWLQFLEAVLLVDVGAYWGHRLTHTVPFLWRFHSVHHSIEEMDWLAAARLHPIDSVFTKCVSILPLALLGFSATTFGVAIAIFTLQALFLHANTSLRFGPLRWVIGTPEWHHWHHASDAEARNTNFAALLPWIDVLFGTAHMPKRRRPQGFGLDASTPPVGTTWWSHMRYPFEPAVAAHAVAAKTGATSSGAR
jgi:sterol desaturase/sphingolipid hydroxylase (fatty acid hydroxylase superfamily)